MRVHLAENLDSATEALLNRQPLLYFAFDNWNILPFVEAFEGVPAPWPMTATKVRESAEILSNDRPIGSSTAYLDDTSHVHGFENWSLPENQPLLNDVLCSSKYIDWYYLNAVLIPAPEAWVQYAEALKIIHAANEITADVVRYQVTIAEALGWCGTQVGAESSWLIVISKSLRSRVERLLPGHDMWPAHVSRPTCTSGIVWIDKP